MLEGGSHVKCLYHKNKTKITKKKKGQETSGGNQYVYPIDLVIVLQVNAFFKLTKLYTLKICNFCMPIIPQ